MKKSGEKAPRDLSPLWAVGRTLVHKAVNMRFETLVFDVSPIVPIGKKNFLARRKPPDFGRRRCRPS